MLSQPIKHSASLTVICKDNTGEAEGYLTVGKKYEVICENIYPDAENWQLRTDDKNLHGTEWNKSRFMQTPNASTLACNLYRAAYDAVHPLDENGKRVTRCKGSSLPVLNHFLLTDHDGRLAIYTHDLETPVVTYAAARIDESFAICVPAHPFLDWMNIIGKESTRVDLTLDPRTHELAVQADNARATFKCMDAGEFPPVTEAQEPGAKDPTLASVGLAVSKDPARPSLQRVCHRDGLMIGTDGFRLHLAPSDKTDIPEGFPDVAPILETLASPACTIVVPALSLQRAVKNLKATAKAGDGWVTFHSNGFLELSASTEEGDTGRAEVEILNSTGEAEFTLQWSYVQDALTHISPKVKRAKRDGLFPQTVTLHTTAQPDPWTKPGYVWFVNGELKAAIMPKADMTIPEGTAKPSKSELMSAYNRKRAQLRREKKFWQESELNRAFGNLQRRNWQEVTPEHAASYSLLVAIVERRTFLARFEGFSTADISKVYDFISTPADPAEAEKHRITRPEYEPHPETPAYRWCNATQCYTLNHAPEVQS